MKNHRSSTAEFRLDAASRPSGGAAARIIPTWAFVCVAFGLSCVRAAEPMRYVYHPPESALDTRYVYHWKILETALEKTKQEFGPYVMEPSVFMTEKRQAFELRNPTGKLTVMYLDTTPEFERELVPIRIPVDKNLGGYRIFLVREDNQARFAAVESLEDLRRFRYGFGLGWTDVGILEQNRFTVVTGSSYDGLFEMLAARRFDVFLRAAIEIVDEFEARKSTLPNLRIEDTLCLYYPLPMYFWFSRTTEGRALAARAEKGMRTMIADGSYDRIFTEYQHAKIERLRLRERKLFKIDNPFVGAETPFTDRRLWFDPQTYQPAR